MTTVRPMVRRVAIALLMVLVPIAVHRVWDEIEMHRLAAEIDAIRARGEPVTARDGGVEPLPGEAQAAASYYLAGAMLTLGRSPGAAMLPIRKWFAAPQPDRQALVPLTPALRQLVDDARDALTLADLAAALPFNGFPAGTDYSYRTASLSQLATLIAARTINLSVAGDGDAAIESVLSGLRLRRASGELSWSRASDPQVAIVLSLTRPSADALNRLQTALDAEDPADADSRTPLLRWRATYLGLVWRRYYGSDPHVPFAYTLPMRSVGELVVRPLYTHRLVADLRRWAELMEVARMPWPERARAREAEVKNEAKGVGDVSVIAFVRVSDATPLIVDRSSAIAVAIERFRRDHEQHLPQTLAELVPRYLSRVPLDPFSGEPLRFRVASEAYTIYSVGANQREEVGVRVLMSDERRVSGDSGAR